MTPAARSRRCSDCEFYAAPTSGHVLGECRRSQPSRTSPKAGDPRASWPAVLPEDWCGSFKRVDALAANFAAIDGRHS